MVQEVEESIAYMLPPRALFLGSYPPRECGIATFTKDMVDAYDRAFGFTSPVIAVDEPGAQVRRYPGEVVGRRQISKQVWNVDFEGVSNVVDVAIKRLRRKVDVPFGRPLIHAVYGVGYVLEER